MSPNNFLLWYTLFYSQTTLWKTWIFPPADDLLLSICCAAWIDFRNFEINNILTDIWKGNCTLKMAKNSVFIHLLRMGSTFLKNWDSSWVFKIPIFFYLLLWEFFPNHFRSFKVELGFLARACGVPAVGVRAVDCWQTT